VQSAIFSGNTWGLSWRYSGLISDQRDDDPPVVKEVVDILDMWSCIEESYKRLSEPEKKNVEAEAQATGQDVKYEGFDGNNESEHMSVARFLINDLERFQSFKSRADLNSHFPILEVYRRMSARFLLMRPSLSTGVLNPAQLVEVLKARIHPEHRKKSA